MKSTDVIQPKPMVSPIANEGLKFDIPQNPTQAGLASVVEGFPEITMKSLKDGGLPPRGQDANGMFYLSTDQKVYLQNGGVITFSEEVSNLIGGYPKNAILDYIDGNDNYFKVQSLIDNNTNNFVENPALIDGSHWKKIDFGGGSGYAHNLGDIIISPHKLTGPAAAYTAEQGTYTLSTDTAYYAYCLERKEAGTEQTITVGEYSFTGYVYNDDEIYYDISEKPAVDNIYNATGKAFYYGVDTENQRVFLPRLKNVFIGMGNLDDTLPVNGNGTCIGLHQEYQGNKYDYGMIYTNVDNGNLQYLRGATGNYGKPVSDSSVTGQGMLGTLPVSASKDNTGYETNISQIKNSLQPAYLYFCVGNTLVNTANIDVEKLTGDVRNLENNKADKTEVAGNWTKVDKTIASNVTLTTTYMEFDLKTLGIPDDGYPYEICVAWESEQELSSGVCLYNSENFGLQFRGNVLIQQDFMPIYADKVFKARTIYGSILTSYIKLIACRRLGKQIQEEN